MNLNDVEMMAGYGKRQSNHNFGDGLVGGKFDQHGYPFMVKILVIS